MYNEKFPQNRLEDRQMMATAEGRVDFGYTITSGIWACIAPTFPGEKLHPTKSTN